MDGITFLKHLRSCGNYIPFILFTGRGREEVVIEALKNGADHYLKKGGEAIPQFAELANLIRQTVRRKEAEDTMHNNAARFRALVENTRDLVTIIDRSGYITYTSPSTKNALGYSPGEMKGHNLGCFLHPDDHAVMQAVKNNSEFEATAMPMEFRLLSKDGTYRWFRGGASVYLDSNSTNQYMLHAWYIDGKKTAERELMIREAAHQGLIEHLSEMMFVLNEEGRFMTVNGSLCDFFGGEKEQIIGTPFIDLMVNEDREPMKIALSTKVEGHGGKTKHLCRMVDARGSISVIEVITSTVSTNGTILTLGMIAPMADGQRSG
ncbi:MAG: PAS domain S-box protein [Methanomassiliicoccales archaeon]|nr:PAS domain S-box protein [Methanomassiliicoccales archaeon]